MLSLLVIAVTIATHAVAMPPTPVNISTECTHRNKTVPEGKIESDNPCDDCYCRFGRVSCIEYDCILGCVDYVQGDHCCPECPNGPNCVAPDGTIIPGGAEPVEVNGMSCRCIFHGFWSYPRAECQPPIAPVQAEEEKASE